MKWEKLAQREGDFIKNCLFYETLADNFKSAFDRAAPLVLTTRDGMKFTHYLHKESWVDLSKYVAKQLRKNPGYLEEIYRENRNGFRKLIAFAGSLPELKNKNNDYLAKLTKDYFRLYKEPYPYFLLSPEGNIFQNKEITRMLGKIRLFAREHWNKTHKLIEPLYQEIAKRCNTSSFKLKFLKPIEIIELLKGYNHPIDDIIKAREKCFFIHLDGKFVLNENALLIINEEEKINDKIKGQGTYPAQYIGKVRLIKKIQDMKKLKNGEILVTRMTLPEYITLGLSRAGAIITDEGGITCHVAIVSREFKIPALIGTKVATKTFKDGDMVEVNTEKGIAKKI